MGFLTFQINSFMCFCLNCFWKQLLNGASHTTAELFGSTELNSLLVIDLQAANIKLHKELEHNGRYNRQFFSLQTGPLMRAEMMMYAFWKLPCIIHAGIDFKRKMLQHFFLSFYSSTFNYSSLTTFHLPSCHFTLVLLFSRLIRTVKCYDNFRYIQQLRPNKRQFSEGE